MELVYLWVEDYKNIHKQGFNFSPRFNCKYDEDKNELTIDENKDYIENFFGDNINVTAIVGKNGSGKSSLLELITDFSDGFEKIYKIFYVVMDTKLFTVYHNYFDKKIHCINKKIKLEKFERKVNNKAHKRFRLNYSYVCLSPFLNNMDSLYNGIEDRASFASIYNYRDDYKNKTFNYIGFYLAMIPRIGTLLDNRYVNQLFNMQGKPNYLTFKFNKYIEEYFPAESESIRAKSVEVEKFDDKYVYEISLIELETIKAINNLFEKIELKKINLEKENIEFERKLNKDESKGLLPEPVKSQKTNFEIEQDKLFNPPYGSTIDDESMQSKMNKVTNLRISNNRKKLIKNNEIIDKLGTIDFNLTQNKNARDTFYFSSGELALLFYIEKLIYISQKNEDIILLIDENELYMHPDWQKKFLLFVCDLFSNSDYKRQIIISSHSPFLLSDIPKENVIFLKNGKNDKGTEHQQTFGANIHTLLSDSFFMEDGLMGEFAKERIENVIKLLKSKRKLSQKNKKLCENTISIIGEPFLKSKLEKMYEVKFPKTQEEKIADLKAELERLENGSDKT